MERRRSSRALLPAAPSEIPISDDRGADGLFAKTGATKNRLVSKGKEVRSLLETRFIVQQVRNLPDQS